MKSSLSNEIKDFLNISKIQWDEATINGKEVIYTDDSRNGTSIILPYPITALSMEKAFEVMNKHLGLSSILREKGFGNILTITEDLWHRRPQMMKGRLLSHLGQEHTLYARNCEIRRIEKAEAAEFLNKYHSYGDASCRYRYGIFLKRHTGHSLEQARSLELPEIGSLVAVGEFSNGRKWLKNNRTIKSYEWTRYASMPQVRICGGMGRVLKHFINEVAPDDIMSYADLEWSQGNVYRDLGFEKEGTKEPVEFYISPKDWERIPAKRSEGQEKMLCYINLGSIKYRLKLTDWI